MGKVTEINLSNISKFLLTCNTAELIYIQSTTDFANALVRMIRHYRLDRKKFCELMEISPSIYKKYTKGAYNYSLKDFAKYNIVIEKLKDESKLNK